MTVQDAGIVFDLDLPPLDLEGGGRVDVHRVRGWIASPDQHALLANASRFTPYEVVRTWPAPAVAPPNLDDDIPTVLLVHALTGDMRAGGPGGWWGPLHGRGRALDPSNTRILCFNNLGGCYGSSGPTDPRWPRDAAGPRPVTTWDQARSLAAALGALGIATVELVAGGSLGAMIALALAVLWGPRVRRVLPIAGSLAASAWLIGWNHVARQILALQPERGLEVARQLAMLTYRAEPGLDSRQGRRQRRGGWAADGQWEVASYLEHQGAKLARRFDAESYALQLGAMDHHDLSRNPGMVRSSALIVSIDTDQLYTPAQSDRLREWWAAAGGRAERAEIRSPHGHDAFLIEWDALDALLRQAASLPPPRELA